MARVDENNYYDEMNKSDFNFQQAPQHQNPIMALEGAGDTLSGVVEDIRNNNEAYGKDQVLSAMENYGSGMSSGLPEVMGPGNSQQVALDRSQQGGFGQMQQQGPPPSQFDQFMSGPTPSVSQPGFSGAAQSKPFENIAFDAVLSNPSGDISNSSPQSMVGPSPEDVSSSAGRLGFILGNNQ